MTRARRLSPPKSPVLGPWVLATLVLVLALGACTYRGAQDPASRKFSWYSFVNGDDIRAQCHEGSPPRYRIIYNGIYIEQVRVYELMGTAQAPELTVQVTGKADVSTIRLEGGGLLAPWWGPTERVRLRPADLEMLTGALDAAGVFGPPDVGLTMISEDFFWVVAACQGGRVHLTGFKWPSEGFADLPFAKLLLAWDPTGIPLNPPRRVNIQELYDAVGEARPGSRVDFSLKVGEDGLMGVSRLF